MTRHEDLDNLSGAYVLNAADAEEREAFEEQIAASEQLRNEVTELADTAVLLGLAVEPVTPRPELKQSIMAQIAGLPQLPAQVSAVAPAEATEDAAPRAESVERAADDAPPAGLASRKAQVRWFSRPVAALTAVAAAVGLIVGGIAVAGSLQQTSVEQREQAARLAEINSAPDMERAEIAFGDGGTATLVWSESLGASAFIADDLPELPDHQTYELWYIGEDGARAAGLFDVDGAMTTWHVLEGEMEAGDVVGVTVEPRGGSEQPTTDPVVVIETA